MVYRYHAIKATLNRNINAFRPKVTVESFSPRDSILEEGSFAKLKDTPSSMNNNILQNPRRSNSTPSTLLSKSELSKNLLANNLKPYPQYSNVNLSQPTFARRNAESYKLGYNCRK